MYDGDVDLGGGNSNGGMSHIGIVVGRSSAWGYEWYANLHIEQVRRWGESNSPYEDSDEEEEGMGTGDDVKVSGDVQKDLVDPKVPDEGGEPETGE